MTPVRIGIAHRSAAATEVLRKAVESLPGHVVTWTTRDADDVIRRATRDEACVIMLSMDLAGPPAAASVRTLRELTHASVLLVRNGRGERVDEVYDAMEAGAVDVVDMPFVGSSGLLEGLAPLVRKLELAARLGARRASDPNLPPARAAHAREPTQPASGARLRASRVPAPPPVTQRPEDRPSALVAIGASTGGPEAIGRVLTSLARPFPAAIVLVQHVDEAFAPTVAAWFTQSSGIRVSIAKNGDTPRAGEALLAGSADHLRLEADGKVRYVSEPAAYPYRPSVDVFFESVAAHYRGTAVGVLLTGMGRDGANGLMAMRKAGHRTIAQDEGSSVIYGMPRAAVEMGAAVEVLDIGRIGEAIERAVRTSRGVGERGGPR